MQTGVDTCGGTVYFFPTMLMRISLIVAILAALGAGTLNLIEVHGKITTLMNQRDDYHTNLTQTQAKLAKTQSDLAATQKNLADTKQQLADAKAAQKKAEDLAAAQQKRADDLSTQLAKVTQQRDTAQADLEAYRGTGKSPQEILQLIALIQQDKKTITALNEDKIVLQRQRLNLQNQLNLLIGTNYVVTLPAGLRGKVLVVDPKWDFVVLNIGNNQGVLQKGEMLVSRNGKLVAKVVVQTVEKDRCIANVVPGWKLGDIFEGDVVTPAYPASS
jgi:multidrug efflux pump subunit AcrA (membrane-fusion protein)